MFGLVKKSTLKDIQKKYSLLELENTELKTSLKTYKDSINSPNFKKFFKIQDEESETEIKISELDSLISKKSIVDNKLSEKITDLDRQISVLEKSIENKESTLKDIQEKYYFFESENIELKESIKTYQDTINSQKYQEFSKVQCAESEAKIKISELDSLISKKSIIENDLSKKIVDLGRKISLLEGEIENYDLIETITPYKDLMDSPTSDEIKSYLNINKEKQKDLIKEGRAFELTSEISWNGSLSKGRARQKRHGDFLITAFNAEVDNLIANTNLTNFNKNAKKIEKWFDKANKNGDDSFVEINRELLRLRLEEQRYFFEHKYKKEMELEDQRYMREVLREESKLKKEIEHFVVAREKEEMTYRKALDIALADIQVANSEAVDRLNTHIEELTAKLERATSEKERALSMAQLTRSGYVYIISNKGSFGEGVYKIGMTRRLEPMDRVRELGDASVPFFFDVHALIPSDDAPSLESQLHNKFSSRRVNKVNSRREFFKVSFDEIEQALNELIDEDINLIRDVASHQFEETKYLELKEAQNGSDS